MFFLKLSLISKTIFNLKLIWGSCDVFPYFSQPDTPCILAAQDARLLDAEKKLDMLARGMGAEVPAGASFVGGWVGGSQKVTRTPKNDNLWLIYMVNLWLIYG